MSEPNTRATTTEINGRSANKTDENHATEIVCWFVVCQGWSMGQMATVEVERECEVEQELNGPNMLC